MAHCTHPITKLHNVEKGVATVGGCEWYIFCWDVPFSILKRSISIILILN